ncbi:MAG: hypothetical protein ACM3O8_08230 [Methylococcaceae bacterium]|nr:hypothetical protein [Prolixibacteraceae bacterium]
MKLIEKIAYTTFGINVLVIFFAFIIVPVLIVIAPEIFDLLSAHKGLNPYNLTFTILNFAVIFHWVYCLWFLLKYDRYSKSLIPLFFFNALYAPIYFYRVKIKKRPLRNKINIPAKHDKTENSIEESDFNNLTRESLIGILELWSSKSEQVEWQKNQPDTNVSEELFLQWKDLYVDTKIIMESFNSQELKILAMFDNTIKKSLEKFDGQIPILTVFMETDIWKEINSLAKEILINLE